MTAVATERLTACPHCGSSRVRDWCAARDRLHELSDQEFRYARCLSCGVVFQSVRPTESGIGAFYPSDYRPYATPAAGPAAAPSRVAAKVERAVRKLAPDTCAAEVDAFYAPPRDDAVLLDFGCGSTKFLDAARARGWRTVGVDVSPATIEQVRAGGHEAYLLDDSTWTAIADESLDMVRMNHVMEHLYDARGTLATVRGKLRTGGRLHVAMPNPRSLTSRVFRSRWFSLDAPRHVVLYPPDTLVRLLRETGFASVRVCHETLTRDVARSVGYLLHDRGRLRHEQVEQMAERPTLAAALYAPARAAAALGVADRYHALAVR